MKKMFTKRLLGYMSAAFAVTIIFILPYRRLSRKKIMWIQQ